MIVIANSQLHGQYGTKLKDQSFEVDSKLGTELLLGGKVRLPSTFTEQVRPIQHDEGDERGSRMNGSITARR